MKEYNNKFTKPTEVKTEEKNEAEVKEAAPEASMPKPNYKEVTGCAMLNIRKDPAISAAVLEIVKDGDKLIDLGATGDWTKVKTMREITGYAMSQYLK